MNKKDLENVIEKKIKESKGIITFGILESIIEETFKNNENIHYTGMWIFQGEEIFESNADFKNLNEAVDYFTNNLNKYLSLYLEFEGAIEPAGVADIYLSYNLDNNSRDRFINILNDIKGKNTEIDILADIREIIDTIPMMQYGDIVENLKLENLKIIK